MGDINSEETVKRLFPEPSDGAMLVVYNGDEYKVIYRDDDLADRCWDEKGTTQRWFHDADDDPMEFYQYMKYAEDVYTVDKSSVVHF